MGEGGAIKTLLNLAHLISQIASRVDICDDVVPRTGLEPISLAPEASILSIELTGQACER